MVDWVRSKWPKSPPKGAKKMIRLKQRRRMLGERGTFTCFSLELLSFKPIVQQRAAASSPFNQKRTHKFTVHVWRKRIERDEWKSNLCEDRKQVKMDVDSSVVRDWWSNLRKLRDLIYGENEEKFGDEL